MATSVCVTILMYGSNCYWEYVYYVVRSWNKGVAKLFRLIEATRGVRLRALEAGVDLPGTNLPFLPDVSGDKVLLVGLAPSIRTPTVHPYIPQEPLLPPLSISP